MSAFSSERVTRLELDHACACSAAQPSPLGPDAWETKLRQIAIATLHHSRGISSGVLTFVDEDGQPEEPVRPAPPAAKIQEDL